MESLAASFLFEKKREKIPWKGEFTLRSDPWVGLIASCGSFWSMAFLEPQDITFLSKKSWTQLTNYSSHRLNPWSGEMSCKQRIRHSSSSRIYPVKISSSLTHFSFGEEREEILTSSSNRHRGWRWIASWLFFQRKDSPNDSWESRTNASTGWLVQRVVDNRSAIHRSFGQFLCCQQAVSVSSSFDETSLDETVRQE